MSQSDEETVSNNPMDVDIDPNESSSSPAIASSTAVLDLDIGSGHISGSDDEEIIESTLSKSSTPDSNSLPTSVTRKLATTKKPTLTKSKESTVWRSVEGIKLSRSSEICSGELRKGFG
jgi:hypothetical protein